MIMKKVGLVLISAVLNLLAGGIIYYFWQPIVSWYWNYRPILGVDFYNTVSYVGYLARHFSPRASGWRFNWWGGVPTSLDTYPFLHFYGILPLVKLFSLPQATQVYMIATLFLFLFFSYLLFAQLSRNRILALVLAVATAFSINVYGPLVWGGSLPYLATQFFFPAVLWSLVKFFNTKDKRWYFVSSLLLGISFWGHVQVGFSFTIPIVFFLLLLYPSGKIFSKSRLGLVFIYFLIAVIIGYPQLNLYFGRTPLTIIMSIPNVFIPLARRIMGMVFGSLPAGGLPASGADDALSSGADMAQAIAQFNRNQLGRFVSGTNPLFYVFLISCGVVSILSFLVRKKRKESLKSLVFLAPIAWIVFYNTLFAYGIGLYHGGWYRVFWPYPVVLGMLISFVWGDFIRSLEERFAVAKKTLFKILFTLISSAVILVPAIFILGNNSAQSVTGPIETPLLRQQSSAFPDSLNVYVAKDELAGLEKKLVPDWLDPNNTQYRFYDADQRVNIWWSAFFDMPQVKGYIDPPSGDTSGGFYWTDIALVQGSGAIDNLVETWGNPEQIALNNALFLIDWYSAKYLEAEHEKTDSYNPLTSYLAKSEIFANKEKVTIPGWSQLYVDTKKTGPIVWHPDEEEYLTYYEVKDERTSPIAHSTDASVVGIIGNVDNYRTILRVMAATNLNSRKLIPLDLGRFIDGVSGQTLKDMDAVILYGYDYRNHTAAWSKIEAYVKDGGRVFIETGSEVKQTDSVNSPNQYAKELPAIFPIQATKKGEMGKEWQLKGEGKEIEGIDIEAFGPPTLDDKPWVFSQPASSGTVKEDSRIVLSNKDVPLVVWHRYGKGEVVWSGMNLPYHMTTWKNLEEAKFFRKIIEDFVPIKAVEYSDYEVKRESATKMVIKGAGAKGVFFREQDFAGWSAVIRTAGKNQKLSIYRAGPTYPGFMYVVIPQWARDSEFMVVFNFRGDFWGYFWDVVSLVAILAILDRVLLGSRLIVPVLEKISKPLRRKMKGLWEKEDDY